MIYKICTGAEWAKAEALGYDLDELLELAEATKVSPYRKTAKTAGDAAAGA